MVMIRPAWIAVVLGWGAGCAVPLGHDDESRPTVHVVESPEEDNIPTPRESDATAPATAPEEGLSPGRAGAGRIEAEAPVASDDPRAESPAEGSPLEVEANPIVAIRTPPVPALRDLPRPVWIQHRRTPRESLAQIGYRYGVTPHQVSQWNDLVVDEPIPRRMKVLRVKARRTPPPRRMIEYTVAPDDTWWRIGLRHGVDTRDLRAYNWPHRDKMRPGSVINIWIDPIVLEWIEQGPDPVPADRQFELRRGALSIGAPADGRLLNGLRVPEGPGLRLRMPRSAYGTSHAVEQLVRGVEEFHERSDYPLPVEIGSMSVLRGGPIGSHKSHQSGRDVDVRLLRRPDVSTWKPSKGSRVQWDAVWDLVVALARTDVVVIFLDYQAQRRLYRAAKARGESEARLRAMLQYPRGSGASRGLVRHSPGHDTHLHVRFGCGPVETECVP